MKNIKRNATLIVLVLLIVCFLILKDDFSNIMNTLAKVNLWWISIALIVMLISWVFKSLSLYILVKEQNKNIKLKTIVHQMVITEFFNNITPFATGGQPMQIYMLKNLNISVANATNMSIQRFLFYQTALLAHGVLAIFLNYRYDLVSVNSTLWTLIMLGFIINTVVGIALLFISFSTKFNNSVGKLIIKMAAKFKIIKNKESTLESWKTKLKEYHENAEQLKKNKSLFIRGFIYNFLSLAAVYTLPIFIIYSMGIFDSLTILQAIVASAFVLIIGNFVPIPGGSGGIEFGFLEFFKPYFLGPTLPAALIIWRFITYYFGILAGGLAFSFYKGGTKTCE